MWVDGYVKAEESAKMKAMHIRLSLPSFPYYTLSM